MTDESSEPAGSDEDATPLPDSASPSDDPSTDDDAPGTTPTDGDAPGTTPTDGDAPGTTPTDDPAQDTDPASPQPQTQGAETGDEPAEPTPEPGSDVEPVTDDPGGLLAATQDRLPYPETSRNVLYAILATTVASLVLRFIWLGSRVAHQDEGRVGYWIIRYLESGVWEYRAIVHGPFLFHVNKWVFGFIGPSDFSSRLAVAVIGGTLPLVAWLFRKHLRDTEVIALALLLASNPVLVYYSRFMRNDVPLAMFMLAAVGFGVRYYDDRKSRYVYGAVGAFALGMTTKENGLLYAACWLGAAALLLDHRLLYSRLVDDDRGPLRTALAYLHWLLPVTFERIPALVEKLLYGESKGQNTTQEEDGKSDEFWLSVHWRRIGVLCVALVQFFAVIVFFYAPRGGAYMKVGGGGPPDVREETTGEMGLYWSIDELLAGDPSMFLAVLEEATVGSWEEFTRIWGEHEHSYVLYLQHYVDVMIAGALVISAFAVLGFLIDRYGNGGPRDLVALAGYWGFVSVLGYPIATDIRAAWATSHAIVPLAIPAAVGLAIIFRWLLESFTLEDGVGVVLAALLVVAVFGQMGFVLTTDVYQDSQSPDNDLVQYAQPSTDTKPTLERVQQLGLEHGGPGDVDVLFWGQEIAVDDESQLAQAPAAGGYYPRRTWMWYMKAYQYDANRSGEHFVYSDTDNASVLNETRPPVVITFAQSERPRIPKDGGEELHEWLLANGYEQVSHQRYGDDPEEDVSRPILFYLRVNPNESTDDRPLSGPQGEPWPRPVANSHEDRETSLAARTLRAGRDGAGNDDPRGLAAASRVDTCNWALERGTDRRSRSAATAPHRRTQPV